MEAQAYPLLSYKIGTSPGQPTIAVFQLQTEAGFQTYAATKEILVELGNALLQQSANLKTKGDLS